MPTYEYHCDACGHNFEQFQSITAAPIKQCPVCKKKKVRRLIGTGAGLIFKGSGFYITDYRSEGYKEKAKAEAGGSGGGGSSESKPAESSNTAAAASAESKAGGKAESTPAAKPEPKPAAPKPESKPPKKKD